ncbi:MAG TPA: hypothetical protein VNG51_18600 [Ktedonobacteraceae bacterium]|nr:hypothetical protein [Ktedonobacteraceae bacterium]
MSKQITRQPSKQQRRRDRREDDRRREEERLHKKRTNRIILGSVIAAIVLIIAGSVFVFARNSMKSGAASLHAPTTIFAAYPEIDNNVECDAGEQLAYHIHSYLVIYINGKQSLLPANTGIASDGTCYYWLHTHDTTGVIHEESPDSRTFILGNFFDEWEQVFSSLGYPSQLDASTGWTVYVNGNLYKGNFRNIPLKAHTIITMAYNSPGVKPVTSYNWNGL